MPETRDTVESLDPAWLAQFDDDPYWHPQDQRDAENATAFTELSAVARRVAARMPRPLCVICGPVRTGGAGTLPLNLERFAATIALMRRQGYSVFNQLPFERHLWRVERLPGRRQLDILDVFYAELFESGLIGQMFFMPDWESSFGARWEHDTARRLLIPVAYLQNP